MNTKFLIGDGLKGVVTRAWTKPQSTSDEICSALRNCKPASHDDITNMLACFASMVQKQSALTDKGISMVVDMLDETNGQVAHDKYKQQAETMWMTQQQEGAAA